MDSQDLELANKPEPNQSMGGYQPTPAKKVGLCLFLFVGTVLMPMVLTVWGLAPSLGLWAIRDLNWHQQIFHLFGVLDVLLAGSALVILFGNQWCRRHFNRFFLVWLATNVAWSIFIYTRYIGLIESQVFSRATDFKTLH